MKPILSRPITRETKDGHGDYVAAADYQTDHGRADFHARQMARIAAANLQRELRKCAVVQPLTPRKGSK